MSQLRNFKIRGTARHANQILQMFLFGIWPGKKLVAGGVRAADIARVPRVSPARMLRRALQHQHAAPCFTRGKRRAQRSVPATHDNDVVVLRHFSRLSEKLNFLSFRGALHAEESLCSRDYGEERFLSRRSDFGMTK